tara:strand:+ start:121 stop:1032 length:912 start_codon:yes stop_codon:yes gene_type:complete
MIGYGQDDKIILNNGDTIYGNVVEVGVNSITYQYKDEATNNIVKKRDVAKVFYSSGRIQEFIGLEKLEKLNKPKKQRPKFFDSFSASAVFGISINKMLYEAIIGNPPSLSSTSISTLQGIGFKYALSESINFNLQLISHTKGESWARNFPDLIFGDMIDNRYGFIYPTQEDMESLSSLGEVEFKKNFNYISLPITIEQVFSFGKPKITLTGGLFYSNLISIQQTANKNHPLLNFDTDFTRNYSETDYGGVCGVGFMYNFSEKMDVSIKYIAYLGLADINENDWATEKTQSHVALIELSYKLKK